MLANHQATVVLAVDPANWQSIADLADVGGRVDAAAALLMAEYDATVLTRRAGWYEGMDATVPIIDF